MNDMKRLTKQLKKRPEGYGNMTLKEIEDFKRSQKEYYDRSVLRFQ